MSARQKSQVQLVAIARRNLGDTQEKLLAVEAQCKPGPRRLGPGKLRPPLQLVLTGRLRKKIEEAVHQLEADEPEKALVSLSEGLRNLPRLASSAVKGDLERLQRRSGSLRASAEQKRQRERLEAEFRAEVSRVPHLRDASRKSYATRFSGALEAILARAATDPRLRHAIFGNRKKLPKLESLARRLRDFRNGNS